MDIARLARAGEAGEARAAGAHAPGGNRHGEIHGACRHLLDGDAAPFELAAECFIVVGECSLQLAVGGADEIGRDGEAHRTSA